MTTLPIRCGLAGLIAIVVSCAMADMESKAAKEAAEYVIDKFGKQAVEESADSFAARLEVLATRNGDEVYQAVRAVGPSAVRLVEQAGPNGAKAVKLMARFGESGAHIIINPKLDFCTLGGQADRVFQ